MGKQAKKSEKSDAKTENQQRHIRATRYTCSKRRHFVWESVQKNGDVHEVTYPYNTQWDWSLTHDAVKLEDGITKLMIKKPRPNLWEPFDRLMDDWTDNLMGFVEYHKAKVNREILDNGRFRYIVYVNYIDGSAPKGKAREVLLTVESSKNLNFGSSRRRRKKK